MNSLGSCGVANQEAPDEPGYEHQNRRACPAEARGNRKEVPVRLWLILGSVSLSSEGPSNVQCPTNRNSNGRGDEDIRVKRREQE